jgi:hypothetical protein
MRSFSLLPIVLVLGVGVLLVSASASASVINVSDGNTVLFSDGFESQDNGATSHIAFPDGRGGLAAALPNSASVGTWSFVRNDSDWESIQVTDYAVPGAAAGAGSKYLRLQSLGVPGWPTLAKQVFSAAPQAGDHIRWEQMINIAGSSGVAGQIVAYDSDGAVRINLLTNYPYSVTDYSSPYGGSVNTGLAYAPGVWQKWLLDYVIGEGTFNLKIGDSAALNLPVHSSGGIAYLAFTQETVGAAFYLDEVPEPSVLVMLTAGLFGLLAIRVMRCSRLFLILCVTGTAALFVTTTASASVMNVTTGQTLFYDDFEGLGLAVCHTDYSNNSGGDFDPTGGSPGSWSISEDGADRIQVTDAVGVYGPLGPGLYQPGANQGNNYLRIMRDGGEPMAFQVFSPQSTPGHHIRFSQMVYIDAANATTDNPISIAGLDSNGSLRFDVITNNSPLYTASVGNYNGTGWPPAAIPISYALGQWQKWQIDYTVGAGTYDLSIGESTVSGLSTFAGGGDLASIRIFSSSLSYIDEVKVPEPSSVVLLVSGIVGLLAYAWRKRK